MSEFDRGCVKTRRDRQTLQYSNQTCRQAYKVHRITVATEGSLVRFGVWVGSPHGNTEGPSFAARLNLCIAPIYREINIRDGCDDIGNGPSMLHRGCGSD